MIAREQLLDMMLNLLQERVKENATAETMQDEAVTTTSPLIGGEAVLTSLELVSFIADAELYLEEENDLDLALVSEQALSRSQSPFRTIETLADYILELENELA